MEENKTIETGVNENKAGESSNDGMPSVRSMTRKQIKSLRASALDPAMNPNMTSAKIAEMVDYILDNIYADFDSENASYEKLVELAMHTHQKAYGRYNEVKN